ncbi:J domain-containing protein [Neisseria sp. S1]|uniref:J domain-containing protein n=1 Tax=Neisseria sp. S1 TaxID=3318354 RepID=UPI003A8960E3
MAKRLHTHYDNLKVARDASPEAIRSAYRALCKQYHPDQNSHPDAHRIMSLVNRSYQVLSNPDSRRAHDRWIEEQILASQDGKISSPMPGGFRKVQEPLPYATLAAWLAVLTMLIVGLAYYAALQREDAPVVPQDNIPVRQR